MLFLRSILFSFLLMCYFFSCPGLSLSQSNYKFVNAWGTAGSGNGQFNSPIGVAVDLSGNVYVADTLNNRIQKFAPVSTVYATFAGAGIWEWNGANWSQITPNTPTAMAASGSLLYGNFGTGAGIWEWNGATWSQITPNAPTAMAASGSLLYGNFGTGAGIWEWNGANWSQITPNAPTSMVTN